MADRHSQYRRQKAIGVICMALCGLPGCITRPLPPAPPLDVPVAPTGYAALATWDSPLNDTAELLAAIGDQLELTVFDAPELSRILEISPNGTVDLPHIPPIQAAGLSLAEIKRSVEQVLSTELLAPTVEVGFAAFGATTVFVGGLVQSPGEIELSRAKTVPHALLAAGGLVPARARYRIDHYRVSAAGGVHKASMARVSTLDQLAGAGAFPLKRFDILYVTSMNEAPKTAASNAALPFDVPATFTAYYARPLKNR